jgi:hypothetical protein
MNIKMVVKEIIENEGLEIMKTKLIATIITLSILISMFSIGLSIPPALASETISINLDQAISFQNEGEGDTLTFDDTSNLISDNDVYGPTAPIGEVTKDYYASGSSVLWFDAISVYFDLASIVGSLDEYSLRLIIDLQKGDYFRRDWQHYLILQGELNNAFEVGLPGLADEFAETVVDPGIEIQLEVPVKASMFVDGWITIRLWNARVDYVALELVDITSTIEDLIGEVQLVLPLDGTLTDSLERAIRFIDRPRVAMVQLNTFIRLCGIYHNIFEILSKAEYDQLIAMAETIITEI